MSHDSLGDRMKGYEKACSSILPLRMPVILRVDGKAFHSYTKDCKRPFDSLLMDAMDQVAIDLCKAIQGAQFAYVQSDEVSVLIHNYKNHDTKAWFDNRVQKMVGDAAATASVTMSDQSVFIFGKKKNAKFDARVAVYPENDVVNYFLWRQQDATRNSINMVAQSLYSSKELYKKNSLSLQEMIFLKGINWDKYEPRLKRGRCIVKESYMINDTNRSRWIVDNNIPIFSKDRKYIENYLTTN